MKRTLGWTAAALTGTALVGGLGTDVSSRWYARLDKPGWQPPGWVFGPAWTTLYSLIAIASARTLNRIEDPDERRRHRIALGVNLALNIGWSWIFFTAKRPRLALAEMLALEVSTIDLIRRSAKHDATSAALLTPYAGWNAFATALTVAIVARNPDADGG